MNFYLNRAKNSSYQVATALLILTTLGIATTANAESEMAEKNGSQSKLTLGAGVIYAPEYEGSEDYKVRALPVINYRKGRFFVGTLGGVGYDLSNTKDLSYGPILSYQFGRDESDNERLEGLGDIDAGADVGAFARWNLNPFSVNSSLKYGLGDVEGAQVKLGVGYALPLSAKDSLRFEASVDWADEEVMQTYFGVTPEQSSRSGLDQYDASSGIRRYGVGASWTHVYTPKIFSTLNAGIYQLGSEAADSPITTEKTGGLVGASVGYKF